MSAPEVSQSDLSVNQKVPPPPKSGSSVYLSGVLEPLSIPAFRMIWIANLFANFGVWAQSVASAWVVTSAHGSPLLVAMIQVAASAPLVLLSIVSGVVADNHDRRIIMLIGMSFEVSGGIFVTISAFLGYLNPILMILSILWISVGSSITIPAWQSAVGEQVPKSLIGKAVLLNSVNYNVARAVGPALGGILLSLMGPAWIFAFNCLCYAALIITIWHWRRPIAKRLLPPEKLIEGISSAFHFTQYSTVTRLVMARSCAFGISASAIWALLPLVANNNPYGSASLYGLMLGAIGLGAILGGTQVERFRGWFGTSHSISFIAAILAFMLLIISIASSLYLLFPALIISGACWVGAVASYNTAVQLLVPEWIKARALALYQTALYAGIAVGSFLWGHLAESMGVNGAFLAAGILLFISVALFYPSRLPEFNGEGSILLPSPRSDSPSFLFNQEHGSVMVTVEYHINDERKRDFILATRPLRRLRLRNGAERWSLYRDIENGVIWQEVFLVRNWLQHLRMLDRMTISDKTIIDNVMTLHTGDTAPRVRHSVSYRATRHSEPIHNSDKIS